jgi:anthranilate synthase/aminodeoxychorismate synthase-like glutamine amidotransferase
MHILLLDNYDSFTYNLADYLMRLGAKVIVVRNDELTPHEAANQFVFDALVLSPGPETPTQAGYLMDYIAYFEQSKPILGVCLGHQAIGEHFGAKLVRASLPMHGKTSPIEHNNQGLFNELPNPMTIMRYHSLVIKDIPEDILAVTASTASGICMAIAHTTLPIWGVQFHPESIGTPDGLRLLKNWIGLACTADG